MLNPFIVVLLLLLLSSFAFSKVEGNCQGFLKVSRDYVSVGRQPCRYIQLSSVAIEYTESVSIGYYKLVQYSISWQECKRGVGIAYRVLPNWALWILFDDRMKPKKKKRMFVIFDAGRPYNRRRKFRNWANPFYISKRYKWAYSGMRNLVSLSKSNTFISAFENTKLQNNVSPHFMNGDLSLINGKASSVNFEIFVESSGKISFFLIHCVALWQ